jgi:SAM-dependent methyltransferase
MTRECLAFVAAVCVVLGVAALSTGDASGQIAEPKAGQEGKDVVWIPTPAELIDTMLDLAAVTPQDFVIDLGSGDGRNVIAAARRGAHALGVEYNPDLVEISRQRAREAGVPRLATFVQGDMYAADVSRATVLALFLKPENLDRMRDKLLALEPGTRIVFNTFGVTDWEPDATRTIGPPCRVWCTAMLVKVPAQVSGDWNLDGRILRLKQYYQFVKGTLGAEEVAGRLDGRQITFRTPESEFSGRVSGDRIEGQVTKIDSQRSWTATRINAVP